MIERFEPKKRYIAEHGEIFTCVGRLFDEKEKQDVLIFRHGHGLYKVFTVAKRTNTEWVYDGIIDIRAVHKVKK